MDNYDGIDNLVRGFAAGPSLAAGREALFVSLLFRTRPPPGATTRYAYAGMQAWRANNFHFPLSFFHTWRTWM
jgi:hypothetical protein